MFVNSAVMDIFKRLNTHYLLTLPFKLVPLLVTHKKGDTHCKIFYVNFSMSTSQENIIEKLESEIERLKLEIFELKGELKITKGQLKEATLALQKQQGYYSDGGNYVE